ncbi:MAG: hypothetical protein IJT70_06365 [Clostridia bacterium]|nr:hypothetical protein [Clostridia bacterium]
MDFKAMVEEDNKNVFLNNEEFAEPHVVKYDGVTYEGEGEGIPVVLIKVKEMKRPVVVSNDHAEGIHLVSATAYLSQTDLGGIVPEQKRQIEISDGEALGKPFFRRYTIKTSDCEMGMITLELEALDE